MKINDNERDETVLNEIRTKTKMALQKISFETFAYYCSKQRQICSRIVIFVMKDIE
jgi:hypothetical protein